MTKFYCRDCKQTLPMQTSGGTGYATLKNNHKVCYKCVAVREANHMKQDGECWLYLTDNQTVTNWPGTLVFKLTAYWTGKHNWGLTQAYFQFIGPDGKRWYGRHIVPNYNQICRVKRYANQ